MICLGKPLTAKAAAEAGVVAETVQDFPALMAAAIQQVNALQDNIPRISEGKIGIPDVEVPAEPKAGNQALSKEAVAIARQTIKAGAETESLAEALEIGYKGFGEIACSDAAKLWRNCLFGCSQGRYLGVSGTKKAKFHKITPKGF
jgi:enoyl-CoA hydratase/3-hydroxyacyl-CoA dehydrogenase